MNLTMEVANVKFSKSIWSTVDMSLNICGCDIYLMHLVLYRKLSTKGPNFHILESKIGSNIQVFEGKGILENCSFFHESISETDEHYIFAQMSTIIVKSLFLENISGKHFLMVSSGKVHMTDVKFANCVSGSRPTILLISSIISIENCTFSFTDGTVLSLSTNSTGTINNSRFENNIKRPTTLHLRTKNPLVSVSESFLEVKNSNFINNMLFVTGTIYLGNKSQGLVQDSLFINNTVGLEATVFTSKSVLRINRCTFLSNKGGGFFGMNNPYIIISSCLFLNNYAQFGGAVRFDAQGDEVNISPEDAKVTEAKITDIGQDTEILLKPENSIMNCSFKNNTAWLGGGILAINVSLILANNQFVKNTALQMPGKPPGSGGAVWFSPYNTNDSLQILNSSFMQNYASSSGGAIITGSKTTIYLSSFVRNRAETAGGATMLVSLASPTKPDYYSKTEILIYNCTFLGNDAGKGGAIYTQNISLTLQGAEFVSNSAVTDYARPVDIGDDNRELAGSGGAICFMSPERNDSLYISYSSFKHNYASNKGGAARIISNHANIHKTTFIGNSAALSGGAIELECSVKITDSHFEQNSADYGGALLASGPLTNISLTNFTNNSGTGGAITFTGLLFCSVCNFKNNTAW